MRLLLDTHYALWLAVFPHHLSRREREIVEAHELLASSVSIWELRIKWQALSRDGERKGPADPHDVIAGLAEVNIETRPLTPEQAAAALPEPLAHRDPFDEQLLIHAQELGARLLTRDARLVGHPLAFDGR